MFQLNELRKELGEREEMNYKFRRTVTLVILFGLILLVLVSGL
jgi:hypothetical protein